MNWEAIGAVGEIIGAIAVVATLAYLAAQIKIGTKVARSGTRQAISETAMAMASAIYSDERIPELLITVWQGGELSDADQLRITAWTYFMMRNFENIHYQYLSGMLAEDEWQGFRKNFKAILEWKSSQAYWANEQQFYSDAFRSEVSLIQEELSTEPSQWNWQHLVPSKADSSPKE